MSDPLVSVIIITYNHEKYIRDAIEGCLEQKTDFPYEVIIHDDASTDGTTEIVREYTSKHPDIIRPIIQIENQYSIYKKITPLVVPYARGKYIAFCEGDDYWCEPQKLQKQVSIMENDPEISMCFANVFIEDVNYPNNKRIWKKNKPSSYCPPGRIIVGGGSYAKIVSTLVKKSIFDEIPEWYLLSSVGDIVLYLLAMSKGKVFYLNDVVATHRKNVDASWTDRIKQNSKNRKEHLLKLIHMRNLFDEETNFKYHNFVMKKNREIVKLLIFNDLLLEDEVYDLVNQYISNHSISEKHLILWLHKLKLTNVGRKIISFQSRYLTNS